MAYESLIAAAIGFAPAILLLLFSLQDYTYPRVEKPYFDDRKLFGLFAVGIALGAVILLIQRQFPLEGLLVVLFFEEALKLIILNLPRFQKKVDTPFYGISLGLGMGSTIALGTVTFDIQNVGLDAASLIILVIVSIQSSLLQGATGGTIGIGVGRGRPWPFFAQAVIVHLAYVLLMFPFYLIPFNQGETLLGYVSFGLATIFLASYFWYFRFNLLTKFISEALSKSQRFARKARKTKS